MTKTVQIERLIELLSSIAGKFAANPTMSHLVTDGVEDSNIDGLILKLDGCAKKTAMRSFEADFIAFQDETPTLEDPQSVRVWEAQDGFKFFMFDSAEHHENYLVPLKYVTIGDVQYEVAGGHINVTTGVATITHIKETLTPADDWHKNAANDGSYYVTKSLATNNSELLCNYGTYVAYDSYEYGTCTTQAKKIAFWFITGEGTTTDEFKEWLATHPIEVAYELATPVEMQLDPVTVKTLNDNTCYIQTYQGCITHVEGEYVRDISAAIEAIEDAPTVEINKEGVTPSENAETITLGNDTFAVNGVEINKTGVIPSETLTTLTQGDTSYSIATGGYTIDVLMGDLDRVYGTTTDNYIGTFGQWVDIDNGKSFSDYDEIILVSCTQIDDTATGAKNRVVSIRPTYLLEYCDKLFIEEYHGNTTIYVRVSLDYTNNKFYLNNFNYLCPIALLGVKH